MASDANTQTTLAKEAEFSLFMKMYEVVEDLADDDQKKELLEKLGAMNAARRIEREKQESERYDL